MEERANSKNVGEKIGFRTLEQKLREMWQLTQDFEITELEMGFYIVRVRSKEDFHKMLDAGPWMIRGHYITISKWKPNF